MSELDLLTEEEAETFMRACRVTLAYNMLVFGRSACCFFCVVGDWRAPFGLFATGGRGWKVVEYQ